MNRTFKETLNLARQHGINVIDLDVAYELSIAIIASDLNLNEEQFETACYEIKRAYMKSEYVSICAITHALADMLELEITTIDEIDTSELLDRAIEYGL